MTGEISAQSGNIPRMHDTGLRGRAVCAAVALFTCLGAAAVEPPNQRIAEVVAARIELQRSLSEWLAGSLAQPASPYRVDPVVQIVLRGDVKELTQSEETIGGDVKFGGKTSMKLPGLGYADAGGNNAPEIVLRGPGKKTTRTLRQLDMQVERMVVRLYVDPAMPKDRRTFIQGLAADLVGIEPARGDELHVADLPGAGGGVPTASAVPVQVVGQVPGALPAAMPAAYGERRGFDWSTAVMSLTAILVAVILAYGLSRRAGGFGKDDERELAEDRLEISDGRVIDIKAGGAAHAAADRRNLGAFSNLADVTPQELAELVTDVDPAVGAAIVEAVGLSEEASRIFYAMAPPERQLEIGLWLGRSRVIARTELAQMEAVAAAALARVRSRVTVGGATRLASFLSVAPDDVRQKLLTDVASRDAAMADAARGAMVVFDDLANLSPKSVRRVVTGIDPSVVAIALVGASDALREAVLGALSKRLRGIIEGEAEAVQDRPSKDVEAARRLVERSMFQLRTRGELVPRAA